VIATELGDVGVMGYEVLQEAGELVALAQHHVAAHQVLVDHAQVVVVAERVNMHEVPHLVTLLREEHGELEGRMSSHTIKTTTTTTQTPTTDFNLSGTTSPHSEES